MQEVTLARPATQAQALSCFAQWRGKPLPVSATSWSGDADGGEGMLCVRLSGAPPAASARQQIGGDAMEPDAAQAWWRSLREQTHTFFEPGKPLWRLALPPTAAALDLGPTLLEWGGGQRWLCGNYEAAALRERRQLGRARHAVPAGGHVRAGGWRVPSAGASAGADHAPPQAELDPAGLFNPGRLILEL